MIKRSLKESGCPSHIVTELMENAHERRYKKTQRMLTDPYHLAGSGSASGSVGLDPGTKKNRDKLAYKPTKIIKIKFFKKEITNFV